MSIRPINPNFRVSPATNAPRRNTRRPGSPNVRPMSAVSAQAVNNVPGSRIVYNAQYATRMTRTSWQMHDGRLTSDLLLGNDATIFARRPGRAVLTAHVKGLLLAHPSLINASAEHILIELIFQLADDDLQRRMVADPRLVIDLFTSTAFAGALNCISNIKNNDGDVEAKHTPQVDRWRRVGRGPTPPQVMRATARQKRQYWLRRVNDAQKAVDQANAVRADPTAQMMLLAPEVMLAIRAAKNTKGAIPAERLPDSVLATVANAP